MYERLARLSWSKRSKHSINHLHSFICFASLSEIISQRRLSYFKLLFKLDVGVKTQSQLLVDMWSYTLLENYQFSSYHACCWSCRIVAASCWIYHIHFINQGGCDKHDLSDDEEMVKDKPLSFSGCKSLFITAGNVCSRQCLIFVTSFYRSGITLNSARPCGQSSRI